MDSSEGRTSDQPYTTFVGGRAWSDPGGSERAVTSAPSGLGSPRPAPTVGYVKKVIPLTGHGVNGMRSDV
ncbi:hypothetical protein FRACA_220004 [Frankia canadensis]|uniref:Uncharacterized protein n=1 Tax=Frankia canadensis TaxID=1836972 RepID=A0A2I2KQX5_9ACTN|nr:hypothetical protein FRACA_220004 [Frankia canadensis]SOU55354.1 hypothetical protein FRACA_220004 [Frankia canadensis]